MTTTHITELTDRGILRITGGDAGAFLQNIITNDMALLDGQPTLFAALLQPQGKILFDFFVVKDGDRFLLDVSDKETSDQLAKRLSMYKLRSAVAVEDISDTARVFAIWGGAASAEDRAGTNAVRFIDPRLAAMGERIITIDGTAADGITAARGEQAAYHNHRIALGVPEKSHDYAGGEIFPHDALLDQLGGVSFTKGCYIGQEVVSRMHHRSSARKRIVPIATDAGQLETGTTVIAGAADIGTVLSTDTDAHRALALIRLDRAHEAAEAHTELTANGQPIEIRIPDWATFALDNIAGKSHA